MVYANDAPLSTLHGVHGVHGILLSMAIAMVDAGKFSNSLVACHLRSRPLF
jgi:hypothetical protein